MEAASTSRGLLMVWRPQVIYLEMVAAYSNWLACKVRILSSNFTFTLINVYGPTSCIKKRELWVELGVFYNRVFSKCCILGCDFNTILCSEDKMGGLQRKYQSQVDFENFVRENDLFEIHMVNEKYT